MAMDDVNIQDQRLRNRAPGEAEAEALEALTIVLQLCERLFVLRSDVAQGGCLNVVEERT